MPYHRIPIATESGLVYPKKRVDWSLELETIYMLPADHELDPINLEMRGPEVKTENTQDSEASDSGTRERQVSFELHI